MSENETVSFGLLVNPEFDSYFASMVDFNNEHKDIYHYTSAEGLEGILSSNSIWLTDYRFLNDTSEKKYFIDLTLEVYNSMINELDTKNKVLIKHLHDIHKNIDSNKNIYIASFSKNPDSLPLWFYYSKNANSVGYNLKFNYDNIDQCMNIIPHECIVNIGKVIYDVEIQKKIIRNFLLTIIPKYLTFEDQSYFFREYSTYLDYLSIFFKHPSFAPEEEVRIVIRTSDVYDFDDKKKELEKPKSGNDKFEAGYLRHLNLQIKNKLKNGIFTPYCDLRFLPDTIKEITISPSNSQELAELGLKNYLKKLQSSVRINLSKIPLRAY